MSKIWDEDVEIHCYQENDRFSQEHCTCITIFITWMKVWGIDYGFMTLRWKYTTFLELVELVRPYIEHQHTRYIISFHVTKVVIMVLRKLTKSLDDVEVGETFACMYSIVYKCILLVCHAFADRVKLLKYILKYLHVLGLQYYSMLPQHQWATKYVWGDGRNTLQIIQTTTIIYPNWLLVWTWY